MLALLEYGTFLDEDLKDLSMQFYFQLYSGKYKLKYSYTIFY